MGSELDALADVLDEIYQRLMAARWDGSMPFFACRDIHSQDWGLEIRVKASLDYVRAQKTTPKDLDHG